MGLVQVGQTLQDSWMVRTIQNLNLEVGPVNGQTGVLSNGGTSLDGSRSRHWETDNTLLDQHMRKAHASGSLDIRATQWAGL